MSNYNTEETANSLKTDNWGGKELAAGGVCSRGSLSFSDNLDLLASQYKLFIWL